MIIGNQFCIGKRNQYHQQILNSKQRRFNVSDIAMVEVFDAQQQFTLALYFWLLLVLM